MLLPRFSPPVLRSFGAPTPRTSIAAGLRPQWDPVKCLPCYGQGLALIAGPCDPALMPEDLITCLPAAGLFLNNCQDCVTGPVKDGLCAVLNIARQNGAQVPQVLSNLCR